jgi:hypothetical protein
VCLQSFHASFKRCRYDLGRWRTVSSLQPQYTQILDANDDIGWDLAAMLLRPRKVQVLADGHVYFTNEGKQRPSASQALKSAFVAQASAPSSAPVPVADEVEGGGFFGLFVRLQRRLSSLEDDIVRKAGSLPHCHTVPTPCCARPAVCDVLLDQQHQPAASAAKMNSPVRRSGKTALNLSSNP